MDRAAFEGEIRSLYAQAEGGMGLEPLLEGICDTLRRHPRALSGISGRYAVKATDTGLARAFMLEDGVFSALSPTAAVDAEISGREDDLLRVFHRELTPMAALVRGKVRVKGSRAALLSLAGILPEG